MRVADFAFDLPAELIAQYPPAARGASRLLVLDRQRGSVAHAAVPDLGGLLRAGDLMVFNDTRVFPARLVGEREPGGGGVEVLLLSRVDDEHWEALVHPGQRMRPGRRVRFERGGRAIHGEVLEERFFGRRLVRLWTRDAGTVTDAIEAVGHVPLPPYIKRPDVDLDRERYQTIFAREPGSIAAPTAGLHFTEAILQSLDAAGVERTMLTLHVGYGTFKPVRVEDADDHSVDPERYAISEGAASRINAALDAGRRIVAAGTTTTRALESAVALGDGRVRPGPAETALFIRPGHRFRAVGALFTNFHLPGSSLLMLVAAFGGREQVLAAYGEAVREGYRFYSYGDAMLIV
ncbi:MAG TPA: tRNA preQ1(34) S-adenosylmethionine ribosyltransferase-isomerase QueA, partial [Vicinamibacterales bacterium]|nr:tRNA preQ1(34) S-adenosylmethionine ribosyltransferase-isomerase QueA [Vicinamibacterales bacterium]HOG28539.1 tRNA preQ1(34) S-adenosylmethionine ribosyltransferase-isomerase QueA [Vicinamibacterales bacterium]HOQ60509.1 tRNA preQ1(34) S-adenosylmethionine ribosyltransferase-isomerase QueA [Vicinamibacterales bacterium]HPK72740.1 tRNA preQ1(34) S-adenosylmethionine ribosyltransferase-isomerase QueA [Vicinamibacterales bacterium]HPW21993.1 tRNA preQ1(34) S-adenosylmethionine ribosyltransfera